MEYRRVVLDDHDPELMQTPSTTVAMRLGDDLDVIRYLDPRRLRLPKGTWHPERPADKSVANESPTNKTVTNMGPLHAVLASTAVSARTPHHPRQWRRLSKDAVVNVIADAAKRLGRPSREESLHMAAVTRGQLRSSRVLDELVEAERQRAQRLQLKSEGSAAYTVNAMKSGESFEARLAEGLAGGGGGKKSGEGAPGKRGKGPNTKGTKKVVSDYLHEWDTTGDGKISRAEFRQAVRLSLKVRGSDDEINGFFDSVDVDGDGKLTCEEFKPCLTALQRSVVASAKEVSQQKEADRQLLDALTLYSSALSDASAAMSAVEKGEAALAAFQKKLSFEARAGLALLHANQPLSVTVQGWPGAKVG